VYNKGINLQKMNSTDTYKRYQKAKKNIRNKIQRKLTSRDIEAQKEKRYNLLKKIS